MTTIGAPTAASGGRREATLQDYKATGEMIGQATTATGDAAKHVASSVSRLGDGIDALTSGASFKPRGSKAASSAGSKSSTASKSSTGA